MKRNKGLMYGLNQRKEYRNYEKVCNGKSVSYTDWYEGIVQKYDGYDSEKLLNFEKYLTLLMRKKQREKEGAEFLSTVGMYIMSLLLPMMSIVVSLLTLVDGIISDITEQIDDIEKVKEQLVARSDLASQIKDIVWSAISVALCYIVIMTIIYVFKYVCQKWETFLNDYRECIIKLRESKRKIEK